MKKVIAYLTTRRNDYAHEAHTNNLESHREWCGTKVKELDLLLNELKGKDFVFADWLAEVGYVYIEQYKGWQNDKACLILHADKFMIDIFHKCVFREINQPTTRIEAEILLFKAFNLI